MRIDWNRKYTTIAAYVFLTVAALICFLSAILYRESIGALFVKILTVLKPVLYGVAIAYLLSPLERRFHGMFDRLFEKSRGKHKGKAAKMLGIVLTYIVFLILLTGFIFLVIPGIGKSLEDFAAKLPELYKICVDFISRPDIPFLNFPQSEEELMNIINQVYNIAKGILPQVYTFLESLVTEVLHFVIGILVSIYILAGKERFKRRCNKLLHALFNDANVSRIKAFFFDVSRVFGGFISGKILDSVIIGILCFLAMLALRLPYATLISVLVGVTNVIPVFGPFIGAIPSAFLILLVSPKQTILFVAMIIALQQLDGNVIGPKILGGTTGLPSFWVIFSLLLFGGFFGVFGMLIAVPTFALIYNGVKAFADNQLKKKGKEITTDES